MAQIQQMDFSPEGSLYVLLTSKMKDQESENIYYFLNVKNDFHKHDKKQLTKSDGLGDQPSEVSLEDIHVENEVV